MFKLFSFKNILNTVLRYEISGDSYDDNLEYKNWVSTVILMVSKKKDCFIYFNELLYLKNSIYSVYQENNLFGGLATFYTEIF